LADLGDYYYAGTVVGALQGIISEAGEKEKQATDAMDKELKDKIEVEYQKGPLHDRIRSWLAEGDLALRKRKQAAFIDWLKREKKVEGISPNAWINRASPAELLEALVEIERLNIR
jgi:hypothetical protein